MKFFAKWRPKTQREIEEYWTEHRRLAEHRPMSAATQKQLLAGTLYRLGGFAGKG